MPSVVAAMGNRLTSSAGSGSPPIAAASSRPPTLRDVAVQAGVSVATVSYVLSGRRDRVRPVADQTRARILAAVAAVGYQRNHAGRSLRRNRTELVGVVYPPPDSPWLGELVEQLHSSAIDRTYAVISLPVGPDDNTESVLRVLREHYIDGAILAPEHYLVAEEISQLAGHGLALVVFDDSITPAGFDVVRLGEHAAC
jgi:LacI family transcriptional regulator